MFTKITHKNVHGSFIHSSSKLETMQMPANRTWINYLGCTYQWNTTQGKTKTKKTNPKLVTNISRNINLIDVKLSKKSRNQRVHTA